MLSAVAFGVQPLTTSDNPSERYSEAYAANWKNYDKGDFDAAAPYIQGHMIRRDTSFKATVDWFKSNAMGLVVPLNWYSSFNTPVGGILPSPYGTPLAHCIAVKGVKEIQGKTYLVLKPHLGEAYGYAYISEEVWNATQVFGVYAFQTGWRWLTMLSLLTNKGYRTYLINRNAGVIPSAITNPMPNSIYNQAKASLGKHLTLDPSVPDELGCAEAVSTILTRAGVTDLPLKGFPGTQGLDAWLSKHFTQVDTPTPGAIVMSSTVGANHGHCGVVGYHGIMSNDSSNGLWAENYTLDSWSHSFKTIKGLEVKYYEVN